MHNDRWHKYGSLDLPERSSSIPPELRFANGDDRLRNVWRMMQRRCLSPKDDHYQWYGGRGIRVCNEWEVYETFRAWALAVGYRAGLTIDRIDNDGNYESGNCRWITRKAQNRNKRNNRLVTAFGETKTMTQWAEDPRCRVSYAALNQRIARRKWDVERALSTPTV